jgi:uncharacterized protein (TIGR00251 family)
VTLSVRVQPRAAQDALAGVRAGALVVRLNAPPVDGRANEALLRFLGRVLDVPPSAITVVRGASGRDKVVRIAGTNAATVRARLADAT